MRDHKIHARSRDLSKTMNSVGYWEPDIADINSIFSGAETSTRACHISTFNKVVLMLVLELGLVFIQRIQHRASFFVRSSFIIYI
jgi:hypothetical protein